MTTPNRMWEGLNYIAQTPCECTKNGVRVYQHPDKPRAVCVGCLAKAHLATPA